MNSNDHSLVNVISWLDEHLSTILSSFDPECRRRSISKSNQRPLVSSLNITLDLWPVRIEDAVNQRSSSCRRQKCRSKSKHATCRYKVFNHRKSLAFLESHVLQLALSHIEEINDSSHVLLRNTNFNGLPWLLKFSSLGILLVNDSWRANF
mmetsp:Transcript_24379/g.70515  ORF Transcript_24379/g.70515 Transcript_24379/m.70515 type:complete len:151 (+) Transcript_24379:280-732(+)